MKKVLIIDDMHPTIISELKEMGFEVDYKPQITEKQVLECITDYEGLIVRSKIYIDAEILDRATNLKFIARAGAGLDQIVEEEVKKRHIILLNAPEGNRDAVAEHTIGMMLALMNKMHTADQEIRNGTWKREANRGYEIGGKTVSIIGYGHTGKALAKRLSVFDCKILAFDIHHSFHGDAFSSEATMNEIFEQTDILSLHIPLNFHTNQLVNANYLEKFKKNIWLINTSRGPVLNLPEVLDKIEQGKVIGAALDVLENEKINDFIVKEPQLYQRLIANKKVLLTPHVAGWTFESYERINATLINKIKKIITH